MLGMPPRQTCHCLDLNLAWAALPTQLQGMSRDPLASGLMHAQTRPATFADVCNEGPLRAGGLRALIRLQEQANLRDVLSRDLAIYHLC